MCWDWNNSGQHSLIGEFYTTLKVLTEGPGATNRYKLIHPEKQVRSHLLNSVSFILWYLIEVSTVEKWRNLFIQ